MSLEFMFVPFAGSFMCWVTMRLEVLLAPNTLWHSIGQENKINQRLHEFIAFEDGSISGGLI